MLPEALYQQQGGRAWWRLTLPVREVGALPRRLAQARHVLAGLAAVEAQAVSPWTPVPDGDSPQAYARAVGSAVQRIRQGELVKVVLARRGAVDFAQAPRRRRCWPDWVNVTRAVCVMPGAAAARPGWAPRRRRWFRCKGGS